MIHTLLETPAARFFLAHYVLWSVGELEAEVGRELDDLTPPGGENWKQVIAPHCAYSPDELRSRFATLTETLSTEEALDQLLQDVGLEKE